MSYIPKFKTGQTVERILTHDNENYQYFVVVGTYNVLHKYSYYHKFQSDYDDTTSHKTMYMMLNVRFDGHDEGISTFWYYETELREEIFCINEIRGKKYLKKYESIIVDELKICKPIKYKLFRSEILQG